MSTAAAREPARSATAVTALRALSARESDEGLRNPDRMARQFLPPLERLLVALPHALTRRLAEAISPGSYAYFLARTRFVDQCLLEALGHGVGQLLILGAGYDSRAHRFEDELRRVSVFEVDLPEIQAAKRARLRALARERPSNLRYVATDFNQAGVEAALGAAGFDSRRKTFVLWEGVSYFLEERAARDVLDLAGRKTGAGSEIVFDYALASFVEGDHRTYGGAQIARFVEKTGEPFRFGLEPSDVPAFVGAHGLEVLRDLGPREIEDAFLTRGDGRSLGEPLGHLRLAHCRVRSVPAC